MRRGLLPALTCLSLLTVLAGTAAAQSTKVTFASAKSEVEEGAGTHNVTFNLSPAPSSDITVRYGVGGAYFRPWLWSYPATSGSDFERLSGTVTVLAGATTATIPVTLVDDGAHERTEALSLQLQSGTGYTRDYVRFTSRVHEIAITDDDPQIDVSFASASQSAAEGAGTRDVTVVLSSAPNADITLGYTVGGTATADTDYTALSDTVTVSAGATTATIPVAITDDGDLEGDETVVLTLTGAEGHRLVNPKTHTLTIAANDAPPKMTMAFFATGEQKVVEGSGTHDVTVNLDPPPASPITLEYTVGGTATPDSDYTALSGELSVPAGAVRASIPVTILADNVQEDPETVELTLAAGTGYEPASPGKHTLRIVKALGGPAKFAFFATESQRVFEGSGTHNVTVRVNPPKTNVTLGYKVVSGTATSGEDYQPLDGTLPVPAGATTATIPVTIIDDSTPEGEETLVLALTDHFYTVPKPTPRHFYYSTHTLTIAASDSVSAASFATASQRVGGETGTHDVTVNLNPPPASNITLNYTVGGTATPGSDYTRLLGTLAVPAGSAMATIPVTLLADNVQEDPETVVLTLAAGTGYELASPGKHTLTFGTVPTVTFPTLVKDTKESVGTYRVPVHLSPPAPSGGLTVHYSVLNSNRPATPGADYQRLSGELSVPAGASRAYIPVTIIDDSVEDSGEGVLLSLTDEPGYRVGSRFDNFLLYITNHETGDLAGRVQARLDAAVADGDGASANLWRRALAAVRGEAPPSGLARLTQADAQARAADHIGSDIELALLWSEIADAIGSGVTDPPAPEVPEITIAAGDGVTEGTSATFTLTADPAPAAALDVTVTVATDGEFGITAGTQTVTIPTTGSATLTLATAGDDVDEADGSVSVTVDAGTGYTVGSASSGTVALADDDAPAAEPAVTVALAAEGASVAEDNGEVKFTVTLSRALEAGETAVVPLTVTGGRAHRHWNIRFRPKDNGPGVKRTAVERDTAVTFTEGGQVATLVLIARPNLDTEERTIRIAFGAGERAPAATGVAGGLAPVGDAVSVTILDDDAAGAPALFVEDARAQESAGAMRFAVRLTAPADEVVRVRARTRDARPASARAGRDYERTRVDLRFLPGETKKHVRVALFDDGHDEGKETFELVLSNAEGAAIADRVAVGTIRNDDPLPGAWLARFGRTVAEQALDGIAGRMSAGRTPGIQGTVAGQALSFDPTASGHPAAGAAPGASGTTPADREAALAMAGIARGLGANASDPVSASASPGSVADPFGERHGAGFGDSRFGSPSLQSRTMTARDALLGSSFSLTGQRDGAGGSLAFWGRASQGSFDGAERGDGTDIRLDGTVTTGMLGADYVRGKWLIGLALTQSTSEGKYAAIGGDNPCPEVEGETPDLCDGAVRAGDGDVEASLTAAIPYAALRASERLKLWGAAGYGTGEVTLKTMEERYKADTTWTMAAAGVRGDLLAPPDDGTPGSGSGASGPALAVTSDALWARTSSDKTGELAASDSDVTRLRLGLEGSYRIAMADGASPGSGSGASLVPKLEIGARHDGGDAETGFGVELGGGIAWVDPSLGLSLDVSGRTLLAHENDDLKDRGFSAALGFDPAPATRRGPSFSLRQDFGGQAQGGLDALFDTAPLEDRTGSETASRWAMEAAYGFPVFGDRFTGSPHVGLGLATGARDYSLGWRLTPEGRNAPDLSLGLRATRRESDYAEPEHGVRLEAVMRW